MVIRFLECTYQSKLQIEIDLCSISSHFWHLPLINEIIHTRAKALNPRAESMVASIIAVKMRSAMLKYANVPTTVSKQPPLHQCSHLQNLLCPFRFEAVEKSVTKNI